MGYRSELDGLRAIAVIAVVLFHAGHDLFSGGYVGVDVFFVLSGYLITVIIVNDLNAGRFSLQHFYERRARRILPALFTVILVSLPFALLWMLPSQLVDFARSVFAVSVFLSNVLFWKQNGYFDISAEEKPLIHTWSLAVEEQFYVVFPLLLLFLWRWQPRYVWVILGSGLLASLLLAEWASDRAYKVANFYLTPTRAWELLSGSLSALWVINRPQVIERCALLTKQTLSLSGLMLVLLSMATFDESTPFPSFYAVLPTGGATLIILFALPGTLVNRFLSIPLMVGVGLISYSFYLWHQVIFAFARIHLPDLGLYHLAGLVMVSLTFAFISWKYVETPFRNRNFLARKQVFALSIGGTFLLMVLASITIWQSGFIGRYPAEDRNILSMSSTELGQQTIDRFLDLRKDEFESLPGKRILIMGDSYAQDLVNMIAANDKFESAEVVTFGIAERCPKYIGDKSIPDLYQKSGEHFDAAYCNQHSNIINGLRLAREADIILLAANWRYWEAEAIIETVSRLESLESRVYVLGSMTFGPANPKSFLSYTRDQRLALRSLLPEAQILVNQEMLRNLDEDKFINRQTLVCGLKNLCPIFTPAGNLISFDGNHLTPEGARFVGDILFRTGPLAQISADLNHGDY